MERDGVAAPRATPSRHRRCAGGLFWAIEWSKLPYLHERNIMEVSVSDAKAQITDLVRRAEEGEDVVLTRFGQPVARITPIARRPTRAEKRALLEEVRAAGRAKATPGLDGARSQDFLYDEDGLPG